MVDPLEHRQKLPGSNHEALGHRQKLPEQKILKFFPIFNICDISVIILNQSTVFQH